MRSLSIYRRASLANLNQIFFFPFLHPVYRIIHPPLTVSLDKLGRCHSSHLMILIPIVLAWEMTLPASALKLIPDNRTS